MPYADVSAYAIPLTRFAWLEELIAVAGDPKRSRDPKTRTKVADARVCLVNQFNDAPEIGWAGPRPKPSGHSLDQLKGRLTTRELALRGLLLYADDPVPSFCIKNLGHTQRTSALARTIKRVARADQLEYLANGQGTADSRSAQSFMADHIANTWDTTLPDWSRRGFLRQSLPGSGTLGRVFDHLNDPLTPTSSAPQAGSTARWTFCCAAANLNVTSLPRPPNAMPTLSG